MRNKYLVPMVLKTLRILETFDEPGRELGLTEIMRQAKVAKASAFRILQTLQMAGYVERNSDSGNYRLGMKVLQLGQVVDRRTELGHLAMPYLVGLQQRFNETANLAVLDQGDVLYLATVESNSSLRMARGDVVRESIHCTALGKAISAFLPWETVDAILTSKGMARRTVHTLVNRTAFKKEIREVRAQAVAFDLEELEIGGWCVAAPVFDFREEIVGALSIAAPRSRISGREPQLIEAVREAGQGLSAKLGYPSETFPPSRFQEQAAGPKTAAKPRQKGSSRPAAGRDRTAPSDPSPKGRRHPRRG